MRLRAIAAAGAALFSAAAGAAVSDFESAPDEAPAASLGAAQISGESFHIQDPVHNDGLMHRYVIESRFGAFAAYGRAALAVRLREVAALATIAKTSDENVVLKSVGRGIGEDAKSVVKVATNPIGTVLGIPKGISHLLSGYRAEAEEFEQQAREAVHGDGAGDHGNLATRTASQTEKMAKDYADRYLGVSAAERRWYAQLGVDPYTNNEVLRRAVKRLAKIDAAASFGLRFAPVGIPFAGEVRRALDAIYTEDPAVLRKRRREALAAHGLTAEEITRFENTLLLSPTRQTLLVNAVAALDGVEGRAELLRHAISVTSEEEMLVYMQSTGLLLRFHGQHPLARIVAGLRIPTAQLADGRIVVFGAFDAVYWTHEVAADEQALRQALPPKVPGREFWLADAVSPRARDALRLRGWTVHDQSYKTLAVEPAG